MKFKLAFGWFYDYKCFYLLKLTTNHSYSSTTNIMSKNIYQNRSGNKIKYCLQLSYNCSYSKSVAVE